MVRRISTRVALALAVVAGPSMVSGCDDTGTSSIPANPPPIPTDEKGAPMPPPTAASVPSKAK